MKIFTTLLLLSSFIFNQYLQEGLYPDCSYVIVTDDGWRIHKNQEGRVLSMVPQKKHNDKVGKYSFDKFGNLIPFTECEAIERQKKINSTENVDVEISVKLFGNKNSGKKSKFFIGASLLNPLGDATDLYGPGINFNLGYNLSKRLTGEVNGGLYPSLDTSLESNLIALSGIGYFNINPESKLKLSIGAGGAKVLNGTGISGALALSASYQLPRNFFLSFKYQKHIDITNGDDGLEFDANMLDAINLNLNYNF